MRRVVLACVACLFSFFQLYSQSAKVTNPFSLTAPVEPDGRYNSIKVSDNEFVVMVKTSGKLGDSEYLLEKYTKVLEKVWSVPIKIPASRNFIEFYHHWNNKIGVLEQEHDEKKQVARLHLQFYDLKTGAFIEDKVLQEFKVKPWKNQFGKASVKQSFQNSIDAGLTPGYTTPLEYQFELRFSPDNKKIFSYIYDYGQSSLVAMANIYNDAFEVETTGIVPIDKGYINYNITINNRGEVFILNGNKSGKLVLIKFNMKTKESTFLDIMTTSAVRDNLTMSMMSDDEVYVANLNKKADELIAVTYTKFNFKTKLVEKVHIHEISSTFKSDVETQVDSKGYMGKEDWRHYNITHLDVTPQGRVTIMLEKQKIAGPGVVYTGNETNNPENWKLLNANAITGNLLIFVFNSSESLMWEKFIIKNQVTQVAYGTVESTYLADFDVPDRIRIVYPDANNSGALKNITYLELDIFNGAEDKKYLLQNDMKLSLVRNYTLWFDTYDDDQELIGSQLITVGKKGLSGKKTFINLYKL